MNSKNEKRILVVTSNHKEGWRWLSGYFDGHSLRWTFLTGKSYGTGRKGNMILGLHAAFVARNHDIITTHGPWVTLFTAFFMKALRTKKPLLAFTFNHGNGIFFTGVFLWLARLVLPSVDLFVTHSNYERQLLSEKYGIPIEKILFTHWAVAPPELGRNKVDYVSDEENFVCCIGRNNRDLKTFLEAVRKTGIRAVLICRANQVDELDIPESVVLRTDVSLAECEGVMEKAMASIIPLIDNSTGAGHMTIVTSLHYGTPVIATNSPVLTDYIIEGKTGSLVEPRSSDDLVCKIQSLRDDPSLRADLRKSSLKFAKENLSEAHAADFLAQVLNKFRT